MEPLPRLEAALKEALASFSPTRAHPPSPLALAMDYSVFPAGARLRPHLALGIAALGQAEDEALSAAVAIELLHSASLVHDDLPAFDNAARRRGKPSTHRTFGTPLALLAGDALLALSFRMLATHRCAVTRATIAAAACALIDGQALECSEGASLEAYHAQKTAGLFAVAAEVGALAAKLPPAPYVALGRAIGQAYQLADDLYDVGPEAANDSKERGNDARCGQPNAAVAIGRAAAQRRLQAALFELGILAKALPVSQPRLHELVDTLRARFALLAQLGVPTLAPTTRLG